MRPYQLAEGAARGQLHAHKPLEGHAGAQSPQAGAQVKQRLRVNSLRPHTLQLKAAYTSRLRPHTLVAEGLIR